MSSAPADKMPPGIPFIVANEFAERFCFYGINAILAVYMTQPLHFGQANATEWQSLFKFAAYFFPVIGAILSFGVRDSISGVNLTVIGYILMAAGVLAIILSIIFNAQRTNTTHREVIERHDDRPLPPV